MRTTTINFEPVRASHTYTCRCSECSKTLTRNATVEYTINPFNKNEDGSQKTRSEVFRAADAAAKIEAAKLEGSETICRDCEDAPNRALLIEMFADPDASVPEPERFYNTPMYVLEQRKHVQRRHERCECGAECCSGYKKRRFFLTKAGKERAAKLLQKAAA